MDKFDCVVITIPVPQILNLSGITELLGKLLGYKFYRHITISVWLTAFRFNCRLCFSHDLCKSPTVKFCPKNWETENGSTAVK